MDGNDLELVRGDYLQARRDGSGRAADQVLQPALDKQVSIHSIYLDIFQSVAYEIGRLLP